MTRPQPESEDTDMSNHFAAIATIVTTLLAPVTTVFAQAEYQKPPFAWNGEYDRNYITRNPVDGYSGPALNSFPPSSFSHCDYHRIPIRTCDADGRCKATAWRLHQFCY